MGQIVFFILFAITLLAGLFAYLSPEKKPVSPLGFMMESTGYSTVETLNHRKTQEFNMMTSNGLIEVRRRMGDLAQMQDQFLDAIRDQQQILKNANKEASDILMEARKNGEAHNKDILQLQALAEEMRDEQRILVAHGSELVDLNNQLSKSRLWVLQQIEMANINTQNALSTQQQRYAMLQTQASAFFEKVNQNYLEVRDRMTKMQDKLNDLANNAAQDSTLQQQSTRERIGRMLDKQREDMLKLAETQERTKNLLLDARQNFLYSKEHLDDSLQHTRELIQEERQKQEDQQFISRQRLEDQEQRIQDQRAAQAK